MELKEFRMLVPGWRLDVEFHLHFDSHSSSVGEIKIHSDFNSGLPHRVELRQDNGVWKLYAEHPQMVNGEVKVTPQYLEDELSRSITARILEVKEESILR